MKNFEAKLRQAMKDKQLNQTQVAALCGVSVSSISLLLNGRDPSDQMKDRIRVGLDLPDDWFDDLDPEGKTEDVPTMTPAEAAELLHKHPMVIMMGLQQNVFPWGYAIRTSDHRWSYIINRRKFCETEGIPYES